MPMSMLTTEEKTFYTIEDIYALPEGRRAELIDGQIYDLASPTSEHQLILVEIVNKIYNYIQSKKGKCKVVPAPFAVFLNADDKTYLEPDISVICDKDKITKQGCMGAPDWIIEILSPSSVRMDCQRKVFLYRGAGVREYWTVDPESKWIYVYNFEKKEMYQYTFSDKVKAGIYEDFEIDFSEIEL